MKLSSLRAASVALVVPALSLLLASASFSQNSDKPADKANTDTPAASAPSRHLSRGEYLARSALRYRGLSYRWGGTTTRGFDCSGLTQAVYRQWGLMLPRTSVEQWKKGKPVPKSEMKPGDLVFFQGTYRRGISHVGIYVGDGKIVHAASRRKGVIISSLSEPFLMRHWAGARRLPLEKMPELPPQPEDEQTLTP